MPFEAEQHAVPLERLCCFLGICTSEYWTSRERSYKMHPEAKKSLLDFITTHHICALATGAGDFVRCTPIEYNWVDQAFWLFSEGGLKFRALKDNKNVCLAIYDEVKGLGFGQLHSVQISGTAEIIMPFSEDYMKLLAYKHIPEAAIRKMQPPIHLIRIFPAEADYLNSDFKKDGYDSRQHILF